MAEIPSSGFIQGLVQFLNPQDHPDIWKNLLEFATDLSSGRYVSRGDVLEGIFLGLEMKLHTAPPLESARMELASMVSHMIHQYLRDGSVITVVHAIPRIKDPDIRNAFATVFKWMKVSGYDATYVPSDVTRFNAMVSSIRGGYEALVRNKRPEPSPYNEMESYDKSLWRRRYEVPITW